MRRVGSSLLDLTGIKYHDIMYIEAMKLHFKIENGGNKMRANVELIGGNILTFLGGIEEGGSMGLSVFLDGTYVLNFVVDTNDAILLRSKHMVKAVKDIGYMFIADRNGISIYKSYNSIISGLSDSEPDFLRSLDMEEESGFIELTTFSHARFGNKRRGAICDAIAYAMNHPVYGSNLYIDIPERIGEATF